MCSPRQGPSPLHPPMDVQPTRQQKPWPQRLLHSQQRSPRRGCGDLRRGCFWCMEPPFDKLPGVISTTSGYTGGHTKNRTYEQTSAGGTGHAEAMQVRYDPARSAMQSCWTCSGTTSTRSRWTASSAMPAISTAAASSPPIPPRRSQQAEARGALPATDRHRNHRRHRVLPGGKVSPGLLKKNAVCYKFYRFNCGRDTRLEETWGKQR